MSMFEKSVCKAGVSPPPLSRAAWELGSFLRPRQVLRLHPQGPGPAPASPPLPGQFCNAGSVCLTPSQFTSMLLPRRLGPRAWRQGKVLNLEPGTMRVCTDGGHSIHMTQRTSSARAAGDSSGVACGAQLPGCLVTGMALLASEEP